MDAEHRQMGINDPALGQQVRRMVARLARRVGEWREATWDGGRWDEAVRSSVYGAAAPGEAQLAHSSARLGALWQRLRSSADAEVVEGKY
jgi:hypothetical protein